MGPSHKYREEGGGPATGLANDFVGWLQQALQTGSFGGGGATGQFASANPVGSTMGFSGVLNDILSAGGGRIGGAYSDMISRQSERDVNALRARFGASGGTAFGTPAQYAEGVLRSETAPKLTATIGGLQLGAIGQLLPLFAGLASKGISQREGYLQPSGLTSVLSAVGPLAAAGLPFLTGNPLGAAAAGSTMAAPQLRGLTPFEMPQSLTGGGLSPLTFGGR